MMSRMAVLAGATAVVLADVAAGPASADPPPGVVPAPTDIVAVGVEITQCTVEAASQASGTGVS